MTNQHPITPSSELVDQWYEEGEPGLVLRHIATRAAQWGADQELEACITEVYESCWDDSDVLAELLRTSRRPKPLSLRKQAYDALDTYIYGNPDPKDKERTYNTIRRALEALPND